LIGVFFERWKMLRYLKKSQIIISHTFSQNIYIFDVALFSAFRVLNIGIWLHSHFKLIVIDLHDLILLFIRCVNFYSVIFSNYGALKTTFNTNMHFPWHDLGQMQPYFLFMHFYKDLTYNIQIFGFFILLRCYIPIFIRKIISLREFSHFSVRSSIKCLYILFFFLKY